MKIETTRSPSHAALVLRGDFDTDAASLFLGTVDDLLADGTSCLALSFRYVKYVNSTALGAVVRARTKCEAAGGNLVITRPSKLSREVITKMGLDSVLAMFEDEDEAVAFVTGAGGSAPEPAGATADEAANTVMFAFDDERAELIPGKRKHAVGELDSVNSDGVVFRWNPTAHDCDERTADSMFRLEGDIRVKLQVKLAQKGFFEAQGKIKNVTRGGGELTIAVLWTKISSKDQQALKRHGEELAYLRKQTPTHTDTTQ